MKYLVVGFAVMLCIVPSAFPAATCVAGTLASYQALGSTGCNIGTNLVFGFSTLSGIAGATPIAPGSIQIAPSGGTASPTLTFTLTATAGNGTILEALINYSISGNLYTADSIALAGSSFTGNGAVTDIQNYCIGGSFGPSGVSNCSSGKSNTLLLLGDGTVTGTYTAAASLNITDDFTLDSGGLGTNNTARGGSFTDSFRAAPGVPEPASYLLLAAGLAVVQLKKRKTDLRKGERI